MTHDSEWKRLLKGNIGIMILTSGLWNLGGNLTGPFFSLYVLALGGNYVDVGLIAALRAVVGIVPHFLGGYLADSLGRKKMLYSMSFLLSFDQLLYAFAPGYQFLLAVVAFDALFSGFREPAFFALIADSTRPQNRAFAYAMWQIIPPFFSVFSPYLGGVLIDNYGMLVAMRWGYVGVFITSMVASILRFHLLKETLQNASNQVQGVRETATDAFTDLKTAFKSLPRTLWMVFVLSFMSNLAHSLCGSFFVTYASDEGKLTAGQWGFISTTLTFINTAIRIPSAWASDRYGRTKFIFPSLFLLPLIYFLYANSLDFYSIATVMMVNSVVESVQGPSREALLIDLSPRSLRGRINAILSVPNLLIGSAANVAGGVLYQDISARAPFLTSSAVLLGTAVIAVLTIREPKKREE